jgi:hypothetical protein
LVTAQTGRIQTPYSSTVTIQEVRAEVTDGSPWDRRWSLGVVALIVLAAVAGFAGGSAWTRHKTDLGGWQTGTAQTGIRQIAIESGGWTYGAADSVPSWIDGQGTWHDSGWPECLRVPPGRQVTVGFQARVVTVDGTTTRPIVAIDCRPAGE